MTMYKLIILLATWIFFYSILKSRRKRLPKLKATIVTLIFASLFYKIVGNFAAFLDKSFFSMNKQGEIALVLSPLKIPLHAQNDYCLQFKDEAGATIQKTTTRSDGSYCGEFWQFENKDIIIPYKILNPNEILYWASPTLRIVGPKQQLNLGNPKQP